MERIMESMFDIAYLVVVITLGLTLVRRSGRETESSWLASWPWCSGSVTRFTSFRASMP